MVVMDAAGGVKAEKVMAVRRYRRIRQIGTVLRCAEVLAALALLSWSSFRLPDALRLSSIFLRRLASLLISTPFVFLLGNAIVLVLFAKSRHLSSSASSSDGGSSDLYEEFLRSATGLQHHRGGAHPASSHGGVESDNGVVYEDKAVCLVENRHERRSSGYRRTKSEHIDRGCEKAPELQRSATDVAQKVTALVPKKAAEFQEEKTEVEEKGAEDVVCEEKETTMTNEELRLRVEAFIAKQLRFRREESIAIVAGGGPHPHDY